MRYGSVCSGIEAASVAWDSLGWRPSFLSEIEPFPRSLLEHHYPDTPLHGDFTTIQDGMYEPIDLLVGGTPCQSFSVAGLRKGLDDPRGNLMLGFGALAKRLRPTWLVWENVPGVLSSNGGRDFGTFLAMLGELGYGFAYRVLDAQYFGVAQRRRRVFVVGYLGDWRRAAAVLFERDSLCGNPAPRRETRQEVAKPFIPSVAGSLDTECGGTKLTHQSAANGHLLIQESEVSETITTRTGISRNNHEELVGFVESSFGQYREETIGGTLKASGGVLGGGSETFTTYGTPDNWIGRKPENGGNAVGTDCYNGSITGDVACTMGTPGSSVNASGPTVMQDMAVRRLTPTECERLQGFPDGYTQVPHRNKPAADGPRYKALGNSMAVPVMKWIGERIQMVNDLETLK